VEKPLRLQLTIAVRGSIIFLHKFSGNLFVSSEVLMQFLRNICTDDQGQDIAEYAVMLAVILVLVIGTVRLIGGNANNAFSTVASTLGNT
jgi:Flp pilus assembly pilin Flp